MGKPATSGEAERTTGEASTGRARFPDDYGERGGEADEPLAWEDVEPKLREAPNYWITTVDADGRPRARPIDAVWVVGSFCFGGSPETGWVRNLQRDPRASMHLPSGDDVVIAEGTVEWVTDPADPRGAASTEASREKYPQYFADDPDPAFRPFWSLRPDVVYAWTLEGFPNRATRWRF